MMARNPTFTTGFRAYYHFLFRCIVMLWLIVKCSTEPVLQVAAHEKDWIKVRLEEGMVLKCLCPWEGNLTMVSWTKIPHKEAVAVFHPDYGFVFSDDYLGRIEFLQTTPMDGSISMRNVTHQDIGHYSCSIHTFPQGPWTRNVQVDYFEEPTEKPTPEVIKTDKELVSEENSNLTISFEHDPNVNIFRVILEKMLHGQPWVIIGGCKKVEGGVVGEDLSDRGQVICTDNLDISLHLIRVVREDGGLYRCTCTTETVVYITTVLLTVPPPGGGFIQSMEMMYIYIGAGATGLFVFIALVILGVRHS